MIASIKITEAYPPDIRVFITKLLPVIVDFYGFPDGFDKNTELNRFNWGNMYTRSEEFILGTEDSPSIKFSRNVLGNMEFSDEWESSRLELMGFCPPYISDKLALSVECAESFLTTDKGTHHCLIEFSVDNSAIYTELMNAIHSVLAKFKNACIELIENT